MQAIRDILEDTGYTVVSVRKTKVGFYVRTDVGEFRLSKDYQPQDLEDNKSLLKLLNTEK